MSGDAKRPRLPELVDCAGLMRELNITRAAAEALMANVEKIKIEGLRKVYVRRDDVENYIASHAHA